jgi:hypothetical protein
MHYKWKTVLIVLLLFVTAGISYADVNMEDGMWEITAKVEIPGMPMEMPGATFKQCLTSGNIIPNNRQQNPDCKIIKSTIKGNTVTWEMQCVSDGRTINSSGKISYTGDSFKGVINSDMDGMQMKQRMNGRRIGNCK